MKTNDSLEKAFTPEQWKLYAEYQEQWAKAHKDTIDDFLKCQQLTQEDFDIVINAK